MGAGLPVNPVVRDGLRAENPVAQKLGGDAADHRFTEAVRPRTGAEVPICERCEETFGQAAFPPATRFASDEGGT